ncbi:MAG: hypothetical protein ABI672_04675 [Vicinamibacteria bacterium]
MERSSRPQFIGHFEEIKLPSLTLFSPRTAALVAVLGAASLSAEDLTIVLKKTTQGVSSSATHSYGSRYVRFDLGMTETIVDLKFGRVTSIDHLKKQYSQTTFVEMEQAMSSTSPEMEKAMEGIPEGLRHKMMDEAEKDVTVTRGETREIEGVACQEFTVALGESARIRTCRTMTLEPPFDAHSFRKLALVTLPVVLGHSGLNRMIERVRELDGFALATSVSVPGKRIETSSEATSIKRGRIPPGVFALPRAYVKVRSPFSRLTR